MKKIFISAGHSDKDPGASANGVTEADVVCEFRDLVAFYLKEAKADFIMDGEKNVNLSLAEAVKRCLKDGVCVEFHLNAASPSASGVETLSAPHDFSFGEKLCKAVSDRLKIRNRGAKTEDSGQHKRLAFVQAGGLILELFFITNERDLGAYNQVKWLLAKDVAKVLIEESSR